MTTFVRVKANIILDMERTARHSPESWADILLRNTARLTNTEEQKKFWHWLLNPEGYEECDSMQFETVDPNRTITIPEQQTVIQMDVDDEKGSNEVEMNYHQTYNQQGGTCFINGFISEK